MFFILWQQSCHTKYQVKMHVMDGSRRGKLPLAESYTTTLLLLLAPSLKHLEMLWSGVGYYVKITICLITHSSSAVPYILLQTGSSSSCLEGTPL